MTTTTNYGMQLPAGTDPASITPINQNTTFLDTKLKELEDVTDSVIDEIDKTTSSTSGSVVTLTDEAPLTPLKSCVCDIEAVQASGTPSPDNPLAISGWSGVNVSVCGKNLFDNSNAVNASNVVGSVDVDGIIYFKDAAPQWSSTYVGRMFLKAGQRYTMSAILKYGRLGFSLASTGYPQAHNSPSISNIVPNLSLQSMINRSHQSVAFTSDANQTVYVFYCSDTNYNDYHASFSTGVMLNTGSASDTYVPYNNTTTTLTWTDAGIVYGGSIDLTSGVLIKTHENIASYNGETINEPWISSMDEYTEGGTPTTGAQVVYPLTTAVTYQLTPTTIKTLSSSPTNIWADTGDTSITYVVKDKYSNSGIPTVDAVKQYIMDMLGI